MKFLPEVDAFDTADRIVLVKDDTKPNALPVALKTDRTRPTLYVTTVLTVAIYFSTLGSYAHLVDFWKKPPMTLVSTAAF